MISLNLSDGSKVDVPDHNEVAQANAKSWWDNFKIDPFSWSIGKGLLAFLGLLIKGYANTLEYFMANAGEVVSRGQGLDTSNFNALTAAIVSDLLGVPIDQRIVDQKSGYANQIEASRATGASLYDLLSAEFTKGKPLSEQQGEDGTKAFLGFLMRFAIREGNISVLSGAEWIPWLGEFREYGENMAKYLGLGRQARAALRPLIQTTIATPLQWSLNKQYRPTKPSESILTKAFHSGAITQQQFEDEMARLGHSDQYIKIIENESSLHLGDTAWERIVRFGHKSPQEAIAALRKEGFTADEAQQKLDAVNRARRDSRYTEEVNAIESLFVNGWIDLTTFNSYIATLPLSTEEKHIEEVIVQVKRNASAQRLSLSQAFETWQRGLWTELDFNKWAIDTGYQQADLAGLKASIRPTLTLADMQKAYADGLIDLDDWHEYLRNRGYTAPDQLILTQQLFLNLDKIKSKRPPKGLSLSELRKAFESGEIGLDQFKAGATSLNYSAESIQIFVNELTATG